MALEQNLLFISEDQKAILSSSSLNIKFTSILSLLIKAKKDEKIDTKNDKKILFDLVEKGFYMNSELFAKVLQIIES